MSENNFTTNSAHACTFSQKWGDDPFTKMGHTQVPNALIRYAARIGLAPDECWLITCILQYKYDTAHPYPSQEKLAEHYGRSVDTVQRVLKSMVGKELLKTEHCRNEMGHFSHIVYDFTPLRTALNECYWQDHPQERPKYSHPVPMPQPCGMAAGGGWHKCHTARLPYRKNRPSRTAKTPNTMPQPCGTNQTPEEKNFKEENAPPAAASQTRSRQPEFSHSASPERKEPPAEKKEPFTPPAYLVAWGHLPEREKESRLERACAQAGNQVVAGVHLAKEIFRQEFEGRETKGT